MGELRKQRWLQEVGVGLPLVIQWDIKEPDIRGSLSTLNFSNAISFPENQIIQIVYRLRVHM